MTALLKYANHSLIDLLNRLAVRVQPKRHMLDEFGTIVTEAYAAKYISEDFHNYGITDLGMKKRDALRASPTSSASRRTPIAKPYPALASPTPTSAPQESEMLKSTAANMTNQIIELINRAKHGLTVPEIESELRISTPTLRMRLVELIKSGRIVRVGEGLPKKPYRYCNPDQAGTLEAAVEPSFEPESVEEAVTLKSALASYAFDPGLLPELDPEPTRTLEVPKSVQEFQPLLLKLEQPTGQIDSEIHAMQTMLAALEPLDDMARSRAIGWVSSRLGLC